MEVVRGGTFPKGAYVRYGWRNRPAFTSYLGRYAGAHSDIPSALVRSRPILSEHVLPRLRHAQTDTVAYCPTPVLSRSLSSAHIRPRLSDSHSTCTDADKAGSFLPQAQSTLHLYNVCHTFTPLNLDISHRHILVTLTLAHTPLAALRAAVAAPSSMRPPRAMPCGA